MTDLVRQWKEMARRDDLFDYMVPSDVRLLVKEIERLRLALQPFAACGKHIRSHRFVPTPNTGIWVPRTTNDPQPPSILVKHLLDATKALSVTGG